MSPGGIYNNAVNNYSKETQKILKVLSDEAKLGFKLQRDVITKMLSGAPLPPPRVQSAPTKPTNLFNLKKNYYFLKRSQEQMKKSGAYDFDHYRPLTFDKSKEKEALQDIMEFGKRVKPNKIKRNPPKPKILTKEARILEITDEINDRMSFLNDMRQLGEGKRYEVMIKQEVATKLLELERVQRMSDKEFQTLAIKI